MVRGQARVMAGVLRFLAGAGTLMGIITGESHYDGIFTTTKNQISDLGGTEPPASIVVQPSATIFDVTMAVAGILLIFAGGLLLSAGEPKRVGVVIVLVGTRCLGVGLFPGNTGLLRLRWLSWRSCAGGLAAILSWRVCRGPLRIVSVVLGAIALVNLVGYTFMKDDWFVSALAIGGSSAGSRIRSSCGWSRAVVS